MTQGENSEAVVPGKSESFKSSPQILTDENPTDIDQFSALINKAKPAQERGILITVAEGEEEKRDDDLFFQINKNILALVESIDRGEGDIEKTKQMLSNLLKAREKFFFLIAEAINPAIKRVEGHENLYQIGDKRIYGTVIAILDATQALAYHDNLANRLKFQVDQEDGRNLDIIGERLPPKKIIESSVVFSGSSAQDRIQPFGADIDMAEYVKIEADNREEAAKILAEAIRNNIEKQIFIEDGNGNLLTLHFSEMKIGGNFPEEAFFDGDGQELKDRKLRWSLEEIKIGYKEYITRTGERKRISLEQVCQDPKMFKIDYYGVSQDAVIEVTKVVTVKAQSSSGETLINNSSGQANAYQEIYFDDPSRLGLLEEVTDPDKFINYLKAMKDEVRKYSDPDHLNRLKVLKRLYNLLKVEGDLSLAQELSEVFSTDVARIYQLVDRLIIAEAAVKKGLDVSAQKERMIIRLRELIRDSNHWRAKVILNLLDQPEIDFNQVRQLSLQLINDSVEGFIDKHPRVAGKIQQIIS